MKIEELKEFIPTAVYTLLQNEPFDTLRPSQFKSIQAGLFEQNNILVCTPTGSGKTYVAELGFLDTILRGGKKALYIVPLKALANEKHSEFIKKYGDKIKIAKSLGDKDATDAHLSKYDLIITTSEKLDSLMRHHTPWLADIGCVVIDEIHLLNDTGRGPTLEIVITMLRTLIPDIKLIGLSATIGNPQELADWLKAKLVVDTWRPTELHKGVYRDGVVEFFDTKTNEGKHPSLKD